MSNRPLGVSLVCGFFALMGVVLPITALSYLGQSSRVPAGQPRSVEVFLTVTPLFMFFIGLLGLVAAVALWSGSPTGRTTGLAWLGLWMVEELFVGIWTTIGPEAVRRAGDGLWAALPRLAFGSVLFYYLWTTGKRYVETRRGVSS